MKKVGLLIFVLIAFSQVSRSSDVRLNLYTGYVFDDEFDSYYDSYNYYHGKIMGGFQWGGGIEFMGRPDFGIELLYMHQSTTAPTYYLRNSFTESYSNFDMNLDYVMLGFNRHMQKEGSKFEGFGGLALGAVFVGVDEPNTGGSRSATKFAWGLKLGGNIWFSDRIALKIQTQLLSAVQSAGGGLYFGTGGAGAGVSTYSSIYQFTLGGGLAVKVGH